MGLSLPDFCALTPEEWDAVCRSWHESREALERESWERVRWLGAVTVQPHIRRSISPRALLRLPWDESIHGGVEHLSREERERRMADAIRRMGATLS